MNQGSPGFAISTPFRHLRSNSSKYDSRKWTECYFEPIEIDDSEEIPGLVRLPKKFRCKPCAQNPFRQSDFAAGPSGSADNIKRHIVNAHLDLKDQIYCANYFDRKQIYPFFVFSTVEALIFVFLAHSIIDGYETIVDDRREYVCCNVLYGNVIQRYNV